MHKPVGKLVRIEQADFARLTHDAGIGLLDVGDARRLFDVTFRFDHEDGLVSIFTVMLDGRDIDDNEIVAAARTKMLAIFAGG